MTPPSPEIVGTGLRRFIRPFSGSTTVISTTVVPRKLFRWPARPAATSTSPLRTGFYLDLVELLRDYMCTGVVFIIYQ